MYAVIFTAQVNEMDDKYAEMAKRMRALAFSKYGCTEFNTCTEGDMEIAVSYWPTLSAIQAWKQDIEHMNAQALGRKQWYRWYKVDVTQVARSYEFSSPGHSNKDGLDARNE